MPQLRNTGWLYMNDNKFVRGSLYKTTEIDNFYYVSYSISPSHEPTIALPEGTLLIFISIKKVSSSLVEGNNLKEIEFYSPDKQRIVYSWLANKSTEKRLFNTFKLFVL